MRNKTTPRITRLTSDRIRDSFLRRTDRSLDPRPQTTEILYVPSPLKQPRYYSDDRLRQNRVLGYLQHAITTNSCWIWSTMKEEAQTTTKEDVLVLGSLLVRAT